MRSKLDDYLRDLDAMQAAWVYLPCDVEPQELIEPAAESVEDEPDPLDRPLTRAILRDWMSNPR